MTFIPEARLERRATELWHKYQLEKGFDAEDLVDRLELGLVWDRIPDDGAGRILGQLIPSERIVILNQDHQSELEHGSAGLLRFTIAHEIGHWVFHCQEFLSGTLPLTEAGRTWCRGGSRNPIEQQADMFASRLLIPRDLLQEEIPAGAWSGWRNVYLLAETFRVTPTAMIVRLEELRWAHRKSGGEPSSGPPPLPGQTQLLLR